MPSQIFGPFIDDDLSLVQLRLFKTARFVSVVFDLDILFVGGHETVMLLPVGTSIDAADPRRVDIPAGTVWLKSDRLAANTLGFVALRDSRGSLVFDQAPVFVPGISLNVLATVPWTLDLEPEAAPAGSLTGSDANAIMVLLPTRMTLRMGRPAVIEGAIGLAGFGNDLRFDT